jgi:hypothetical protein
VHRVDSYCLHHINKLAYCLYMFLLFQHLLNTTHCSENPDDNDDDVPAVPAELLQDDDTSSVLGTAKEAASATITAATASKSRTTTDSTTAKATAAAAATPEVFQCMVFVERRTTARIVCDLLRMVFRLRQGEQCHVYFRTVLSHA